MWGAKTSVRPANHADPGLRTEFRHPTAWIGGYLTNDIIGVLFFSVAVGAALQVVLEVGRYVRRRAPGGLGSGWVIGGFLAGITVMYTTGLLAG